MFIPLVDHLRCPKPHADTWLVASIDRAEERDILAGTLGCPVCHAEFPVVDGLVLFEPAARRGPFVAADEARAVKIAAALDLTDARMIAVLHGDWGAHAPILRGISPAQLLLVNPPEGVTSGDGVSIVLAESAPLAQASVHGAAVDADAGERMIVTLRGALRAGGRMIGPVVLPLPDELTELVRDDEMWVAERGAAAITSAPIMPARRPRQ